jgi:hypothetical protein
LSHLARPLVVRACARVHFALGRGVLAGNYVYWPLREEILVVDTAQGLLTQKIALRALHGETGGNLIIAGEQLLIARPRYLTAFGNESRVPAADDGKKVSVLIKP